MVIRVGGIVRPESTPERALPRIAGELGDGEFAEWMRDYRAGRWVLVCIEVFADVISPRGDERFSDGGLHSLYFGAPHGDDNLVHARQAVAGRLDRLAAALRRNGVDVTVQELGTLPILIELDPELEARLSR